MKNDPLRHISANFQKLAKNQQIVADYLLNNWEKALYESSITIAKKVGVSQSTVVRTVMRLGYSGFPEFQSALRVRLEDRFSTIKQIDQVSIRQKGQSLEQRIAQVFDQNRKNLDLALRDLDPEQTRKAAALIWKAKRVFVLGLRTGSTLAHYLGLHLSMIRPNVTIFSNDYMLLENLRTLGQGDVLVVFSFVRYSRKSIEAAMFAHKLGCNIIGITDVMSSPLSGLPHLLFLVPVTSLHYGNSYVAASAVVDVLLSLIVANNKKAAMKALQAMEEGFGKFQVFFEKPARLSAQDASAAESSPANPPADGKR
ncbi:MAG: MurR/RpiR family transcriptional regulator [Thermodesulfobacteriota bacterium]